MDVFLNLIFIILGFVLLIKGADFLVNGSSSLAKRFNISEIAIGLTIVAMGTSAPELVVNIISSLNGHDDVVFGNIIGSNIFNMFLILGVAGNIYPLFVQRQTVLKEIPYAILATLVFFILVNDKLLFEAETNVLSFFDAIILFVMFILFLLNVFFNMKNTGDSIGDEIEIYNSLRTTLMIIGGAVGLAIGGDLIVNNAVAVAEKFQVSKKLIGLTILAAGTSLPELATSAVAALQKKSDIAVGNIVGSNIFNILLVLSTSALLSPMNYNSDLNIDLGVVMLGSVLLFVFMFTLKRNRLDRLEATIYLVGFVTYMVFLFMREQTPVS
ncbi:MAG: calcium/sodium antiporter [Bacteroidota bacterium]